MEKIVYALWNDKADRREFNRTLLEEIAPSLLDLGARGLHLDIVDDEVAGAATPFPQATKPPIAAALHLWVDSAIATFRLPFDTQISRAGRMAAYLVTESQPVAPQAAPRPVLRSDGYVQLVFMNRPARFRADEWLAYWFDHHTRRAVEDHICSYYAQNIVVRSLSHAAPRYDAIVEEIYPLDALDDPSKGYRPDVDVAAYQKSAVHMIDPDRIDVIAASQYVFLQPFD